MFKNILSILGKLVNYLLLLIGLVMAWSAQQKVNTKNKILTSAGELFTQHGFAKVSINQVMQNAGLTRGAFYAHFSSKSELYQAAIPFAAKQRFDAVLQCQHDTLENIVSHYLSVEHVGGEQGCPLSFLVSDIQQQEFDVKQTYSEVLQKLISKLQSHGLDEQAAIRSAVLMIGGVAVSRALPDKDMQKKVIAAAKNAAMAGVGEKS